MRCVDFPVMLTDMLNACAERLKNKKHNAGVFYFWNIAQNNRFRCKKRSRNAGKRCVFVSACSYCAANRNAAFNFILVHYELLFDDMTARLTRTLHAAAVCSREHHSVREW